MIPLVTVNQACAMLISDEIQKAIVATTGIRRSTPTVNMNVNNFESTALYSSRPSNNQKFKKNYNIHYEFSKIKGHSKENFYKIIGCLSDFKIEKNGGPDDSNVYSALAECRNQSPTGSTTPQMEFVGQHMGRAGEPIDGICWKSHECGWCSSNDTGWPTTGKSS